MAAFLYLYAEIYDGKNTNSASTQQVFFRTCAGADFHDRAAMGCNQRANMKNILIVLLLASGLCSSACAGAKEPWEAPYKPLKGEYLIYSGSLGELQPPTRNDRKVSIRVAGTVAKDLFDSMRPDDKDTCTTAPGHRERNKDGVSCFYDPGTGYVCYFGFDLRTGKSIGGSIC